MAIVAIPLAVTAGEPSLATLERQFRELPMEAKRLTGPLFWLHGDETRERLEMYLDRVAESGNGCFTAEARPHSDWLGEGWYRDLDICLQAAKKHDMKMWIFDEKLWPSQTVGGNVPAKYTAKTLVAEGVDVEGPRRFTEGGYSGERYIAALAGKMGPDGKIDGDSILDLKESIQDGRLDWQVPAGRWKVMKFTHVQAASVFQNYYGSDPLYSVDGASPDCAEWFIRTVYQPHYDRFGKDFGKTIPGFFYDEPETRGDWGTELDATLAAAKIDWKKAYVAYKFGLSGDDDVAARYQYMDALAETWGRVMYGGMTDWCHRHGVLSMGHFMEHDCFYYHRDFCAGDLMRLQKYSDMGGVDLVCGQLPAGQRTHHIYQMPKLCSSVSHVYGKVDQLTMSEMFGAYGQNITYPEMKWFTDQHQVRGVNFMIPHSFNPRAPFDQDCPPYFFNGGYEPRYPLYRVYADYTSRLSLFLAGGRHVCPVALLFSGISKQVGRMVTPEDMTSAVQDAVYDCDWLPFEVFEGKAEIQGGDIALYDERYQVLIVPPVEVITYGTLAKVKEFFDAGGIIIGHGFLPTRSATIGKTSASIAALATGIWGDGAVPGVAACRRNEKGGKSYLLAEIPSAADLHEVLAKDAGIPQVMEVLDGDTGNWLHILHRVKSGRDVFLVCNQNMDDTARRFKFRARATGTPEVWDAMRAEINSVESKRDGDGVEFSLTLEPLESVLIVFNGEGRKLPARIDGSMTPTREIPVCDDRPASAREKLVVLKATYGVPGDAVRSRDIKRKLQKIIDAGRKSFLVAELADGDDPAQMVVKTLEAECALGDKRVRLEGTDPERIALREDSGGDGDLGAIAAGRPYTASPVEDDTFEGTCTVPAGLDLAGSRICIEMDELTPEGAASVIVNGAFAGGCIGKPYRLDITRHLKTGENTIKIAPFAPKAAKLVVYDRR